MAESVDDRGRGARLARRDEGAYCSYVTEEQRSQAGCIGRENDRLTPFEGPTAIVEPVRAPAPLLDPEFERIVGAPRTLSERGHPRETPRDRAEQVAGCALAPERSPPE